MSEILQESARLLVTQIYWLRYSYDECKGLLYKELTPEEFGKFETLCSRYARSIDFLIRKFYRTLDLYEFNEAQTLLDVVHNAQKRGLLDDVDELRQVKELRNMVVHEYIEEDLQEHFEEIIKRTPKLLELMERALEYVKRYGVDIGSGS